MTVSVITAIFHYKSVCVGAVHVLEQKKKHININSVNIKSTQILFCCVHVECLCHVWLQSGG